MTARTLRWLIAVALAVAGPILMMGPATATGTTYCTGSGVNVVIDFGSLQGGVQKGCGSGTVAADAIQSAGFTLGYVQTGGMSGFVCTVSGKPGPSQGGCTGANGNGYWALFVASAGGQWSYANLGANSQPVSNGQTVSFAWQAPGSGQRDPGTAPAARVAPKPKPTPTPTSKPSSRVGAGTSAGATVTKSPTTRATANSSASPKRKASTSPTPSATASPSTWSSAAPAPSSTVPVSSSTSGGGLPWWIPVLVVAALLVGAGAAWWRKRADG